MLLELHTETTMDERNTIKGWDFYEEETTRAVKDKKMINPSLDLTNACNLNCPYCYKEEKDSKRKNRRANELSIEETCRVIKDFKKLGAKTVNIVGAGEPTIDPYFRDVINCIYENDMTSVLFTNGIAFESNDELIDFCYMRDVSVVLKCNSRSPLVQDLVCGRKGYSEKRDKALLHLMDAGFNDIVPTRLGLNTMVFKGNIEEIPAMHKWCRDNNVYPMAGEYIPSGRTAGGDFMGYESLKDFGCEEGQEISSLLMPISSRERSMLLSTIYEIDKSMEIERSEGFAYYGGGACTQTLGVYVDIQGDIWPCVAKMWKNGSRWIKAPFGNIRDGGNISDIWDSNRFMSDVRDNFDGSCMYKKGLL